MKPWIILQPFSSSISYEAIYFRNPEPHSTVFPLRSRIRLPLLCEFASTAFFTDENSQFAWAGKIGIAALKSFMPVGFHGDLPNSAATNWGWVAREMGKVRTLIGLDWKSWKVRKLESKKVSKSFWSGKGLDFPFGEYGLKAWNLKCGKSWDLGIFEKLKWEA